MITAKEVLQYFIDNGDVGSVMTPSGKVKAKVYHLPVVSDREIEEWIYKRIEKYSTINYIYANYKSGKQLKANQEYYKAVAGLIVNDNYNKYRIHNVSVKIPQDVIPELAYDKIIVCISLTEVVFDTLINMDSYIDSLKRSMEDQHNETINAILLDLGKEEQAWETMQKEIKENGL